MAARVILDARAKPGTGSDLVEFFRSIMSEARDYEGCLSVDTLQNSDDADNVVLVEEWEAREQYETYVAWRRAQGVSDRLMQLLAAPPNIRHFDVTGA